MSPARVPAVLDARQAHRLAEQIAEGCDRLSLRQARQLAALCTRCGFCWASRAKLAAMLDIGRRTLDRALAELAAARVFVVVTVEGRRGGTALVPSWCRDADPGALIAGVLRRAGLDVVVDVPAAGPIGMAVRGVAKARAAARGLPVKAAVLLLQWLKKLRHGWHRESGAESLNPVSSPTASPKENPATEDPEPAPGPSPEAQPAQDRTSPSSSASGSSPPPRGPLSEALRRLAEAATRMRPSAASAAVGEARQAIADPTALRASARRLGIPVRPPAPGEPTSPERDAAAFPDLRVVTLEHQPGRQRPATVPLAQLLRSRAPGRFR